MARLAALLLLFVHIGTTEPKPIQDLLVRARHREAVPAIMATSNHSTHATRLDGSRRRLAKASVRLPMAAPEDAWQRAPIIVGGTGGSGTRGVVAVLTKLGIYMVYKGSLAREIL